MENTVAKPNKYLQPFAHMSWKIVGAQIEKANYRSMHKKQNSFVEFVYRFSNNILGLVGFFTLLTLIIMAFTIPYTTLDPTIANVNNKYKNVFTDNHYLGTDNLGRDVWAILWHGLRFSFLLAFSATAIDLILGVLIGTMMGYFDKFDRIMQQIIKIGVNIPTILIMIILLLVFDPSFWFLVLSMTITGWIGMANQMRAQIKRAKNFEWVIASKVLGTPSWKIIKNFFPVLIPMIITQLVFTIPGAILSETSLAVIGLSIPNEPTLGNLISDGASLVTIYPRYAIIPSTILIVITTSIQFIGNSLQEATRRQR